MSLPASLRATMFGCSAARSIVSTSIFVDGPARDVVDDHGQVRRVGDRPEVVEQRVLRGPVVVRRDDERRVGARLLRFAREVDRVRRPVRARARRSPMASEPTASLTARNRSTCSASVRTDASPVDPATTRPSEPWATRWRRELLRLVQVEAAVLAERRDHRGDDSSEACCHRGLLPCRCGEPL